MILSQARTARGGHRDFNRDEHADSSDVRHDSVPVPQHFLVRVAVPTRGHEPVFAAISDVISFRYFLRVARGVMRRGAGLESLWLEIVALTVFSIVMLVLANVRFRKTL
jgi:hypothetical protein